jgi:hypothetical protein
MAQGRAKNCDGRVNIAAPSGVQRAEEMHCVSRRWKLAMIGILTVGATSLASTLTTAYLMRPPAPADPVVEPPPEAEPERRAPIVRVAPPRRHPLPEHAASPLRRNAEEIVPAP